MYKYSVCLIWTGDTCYRCYFLLIIVYFVPVFGEGFYIQIHIFCGESGKNWLFVWLTSDSDSNCANVASLSIKNTAVNLIVVSLN